MISNFAANAGKKAGEFYTPYEVSLLMSEIVAYHLKDNDKIEIYDPTSGSGSLLINIGKSVQKHIQEKNNIKYYAQELKEPTYNLTRMNLIMRGISADNISMESLDGSMPSVAVKPAPVRNNTAYAPPPVQKVQNNQPAYTPPPAPIQQNSSVFETIVKDFSTYIQKNWWQFLCCQHILFMFFYRS